MIVLNLLTSGGLGGIETLCREVAQNSTFDDRYVFLFKGGIVFEQMRENDNKVYCLEDTRKLSIKKCRRLLKLVADADLIVIHNRDVFLQIYYLIIRKKFPQKKYVYVAHSCFDRATDLSNISPIKARIMLLVMRKAIMASDKFVAVSEAGLKSYESIITLNDSRKAVVYNGIGQSYYNHVVKKKISRNDRIQILYIGRLVGVKGIDLLLESIVNISNRYKVFLTIVGDGCERNELEQLVEKKGLSEIVSFEGYKTNVIDYYKNSNIFVYPSVWQEVFGISIVEAMAMGNICIANRVGGIPEIITDGINGFLTDEISSLGIERAIERAICALFDNNEIISNAIETAKRFSIIETVDGLQKVYSELIQDE